jgi:hypothetical protein
MKWHFNCISIPILLILGGCVGIAGTVASTAAKPILGFAVKDAKTTLIWIEREESADRLSSIDAASARRCPESVIALDALRAQVQKKTAEMKGTRGLIYYGTLARFGKGVQAEASQGLAQLAESCVSLIPAEKLIKLF